jgi:hypothetical protein
MLTEGTDRIPLKKILPRTVAVLPGLWGFWDPNSNATPTIMPMLIRRRFFMGDTIGSSLGTIKNCSVGIEEFQGTDSKFAPQ